MDYRKNMNTPRDMIDNDLLLRLLRENEPAAATFSSSARRENRRRSNNGNCGCRNTERRESRDIRSGGSCGCGNERERTERSRDNGCGCGNTERRENRDERSSSNCGCGNGRGRNCGDGCAQEYMDNRESRDRSCDSCANDDKMRYFRLAMAYVPMQEWEGIYDEEAALSRGTLFEALDLPWYQSACDNGSCKKCSDNR